MKWAEDNQPICKCGKVLSKPYKYLHQHSCEYACAGCREKLQAMVNPIADLFNLNRAR